MPSTAPSMPCIDPVPNSVRGWVHSVESGGTADGPGIRYVLFLAGCPLRCLYCHNPDTRHLHDGAPVSSADIVEEIGTYAEFLRRAKGGVTISGGEPLVQPEFCAAVLRGARELGLHTALDTSGFLGSHADDVRHFTGRWIPFTERRGLEETT